MSLPRGLSLAAFTDWALKQRHVYWLGKDQCVALVEAWLYNLRKPAIPCYYAYQIFNNAPSASYLKIRNTATFVPRAGDVLVWHERWGSAGHVAIAEPGSTQTVIFSLDQNWSAYHAVTREHHHYTAENFIGAVRAR